MQHEGVGIDTQLRNDERYLLRHQAGDERNIAREAIQLRHDHRTAELPGLRQRGGQFRPAVDGVGTFAGLDFDMLVGDGEVVAFGEPGDAGTLRFDAQTAAALLVG